MLPSLQMIQLLTDTDVDAMLFPMSSSPLLVCLEILLFVMIALFVIICAITFQEQDT